ncbi:MAG TPA: peptidylprolyl isomerase [Dehalococcoidia bacterium]|nr:peptidylprolyl isomerase [Dehalococcoidia bacterium]
MKRLLLLIIVVATLLVCGCGGDEEVVPTATPTLEPTFQPTATEIAPTIQPTATEIAIPIVDITRQYAAIIETEKGNLTLELYASYAPITVSNFIYLANQGFYDGTTFHRVIPGFMAQGGDPTGTGTGGPGYFIRDEISGLTHVAGALSMANYGVPNTGGSQFFITYVPRHDLDGRYSVFGQLIEGMDVLESLTPRDPSQNPDYEGDTIIRITIYVVS